MAQIIAMKGAKEAPRAEQARMETLIITARMVAEWRLPPFQRPLRVNDKVRAVVEQMKRDQCIEGVLTLGIIRGDSAIYLVDGQHRVEAFKLSGLAEAIADIRVLKFGNMAEMSDEFVRLNSSLVKMRPDDLLRGLESSLPALQTIRKSCEFVGYDQVRRNSSSPILGMSMLVRCWAGSAGETPTSNASGRGVATIVHELDFDNVSNLVAFLGTAHAAWGRDPEYFRLWGSLNLTMCMWMWRRLVIDRDRSGGKRYAVLSVSDFKQCLMSVSADGDYLVWLPGRNMSDRDRSPCYMRLKAIFVRRLSAENKKKVLLPAPAWSSR